MTISIRALSTFPRTLRVKPLSRDSCGTSPLIRFPLSYRIRIAARI